MSESEVTLQHFYVFNSTYAEKEGEVSLKNQILLSNVIFEISFF